MLKIMHGLKALVSFPIKCSLAFGLLALAVIVFGDFAPALRGAFTRAVSWAKSSSGDSVFDPNLPLDPDREIEMLRSIEEDVTPKLQRARLLLRKNQSELGYLAERIRIIEERFDRERANNGCGTGTSAADVLQHLAARIKANDSGITKEEREMFERMSGAAWVSARERSATLTAALAEAARLEARVAGLYDALRERKRATLELRPNAATTKESWLATGLTSDLSECQRLLEACHERTYRVLYTLDTSLVNVGSAPTKVSLQN